MATKLASLDVGSLISRYAVAAQEHRLASEQGDSRRANRQSDLIARLYRELRRRGPEGESALLTLTSHADPGVRCWSAAHALEFSPGVGEAVLTALAAGPRGITRLDAEVTLEVWRKGELRFP